MKTLTSHASTQGDGDGRDVQQIARPLGAVPAGSGRSERDQALVADTLAQAGRRVAELERALADVAEALGLGTADYHYSDLVKCAIGLQTGRGPGSVPLVPLKTYDAGDHMSGLLGAAWVLEQRGDRCHIALERNTEQRVVGVTLSVEDV